MLSEHFARKEFQCHCGCGMDTVDAELITVLENIRNYFDKPVLIHSGNRCNFRNDEIGGSPRSYHCKSKAADFSIKGIDVKRAYDYLNMKYYNKYGLGEYSTWVHVDIRSDKARW